MIAQLPVGEVMDLPWSGHPYLAALGTVMILGALGLVGYHLLTLRITNAGWRVKLRIRRIEQHVGLESPDEEDES